MLVGPENILVASAKVGVHLARKERVFGNVRSSRVFVEWQK